MITKIKQIIKLFIDAIFGLVYLFGFIMLVDYMFHNGLYPALWAKSTLGELFEWQLFAILWFLSLIYLPLRLMLRGKFWEIMFNEGEYRAEQDRKMQEQLGQLKNEYLSKKK